MTKHPSALMDWHFLQVAEGEKKAEVLSGLFSDVYANQEPHLELQEAHLKQHLKRNRDFYPELSEHVPADEDVP